MAWTSGLRACSAASSAREGQRRSPRPERSRSTKLAALQARNPDVHAMVYPKRGADLERELKWLGSYRYAVLNLGAPTVGALQERFRRLCAEITFHPEGHRLWELEPRFAREPGDD